MSADWHRNLALKIGVGGTVEYTPARVGQTLHVPCSHGHIADFHVNARMPPEAVAKKMMQKGWTVGSKITCPEHSRKPKAKQADKKEICGAQAPPEKSDRKPKKRKYEPRGELRNRIEAALRGASKPLTAKELSKLAGTSLESMQVTLVRLYRKGELVERILEGKSYLYFLKDEPMNANTAPATEAPPSKQPSAPSLVARRATIEWIMEAFDADKGRYKAGVSDASIAKETGLAEAAVAEIRELNFGALKEPTEIEASRQELDRLVESIAEFERRAAATVEQWRKDITAHRNRLGALIAKNGWNQ